MKQIYGKSLRKIIRTIPGRISPGSIGKTIRTCMHVRKMGAVFFRPRTLRSTYAPRCGKTIITGRTWKSSGAPDGSVSKYLFSRRENFPPPSSPLGKILGDGRAVQLVRRFPFLSAALPRHENIGLSWFISRKTRGTEIYEEDTLRLAGIFSKHSKNPPGEG